MENTDAGKKPAREKKRIKVKQEKIDVKAFGNVAVVVYNDFSKMYVVKASIGEPSSEKMHGVVPCKSDGAFNCRIGDYEELRCDAMVYLGGLDEDGVDDVEYGLGVRGRYRPGTDICEKRISAETVDKLFEKRGDDREIACYYGFFRTAESAIAAITEKTAEYRKSFETRIKAVMSDEEISVAVSAV